MSSSAQKIARYILAIILLVLLSWGTVKADVPYDGGLRSGVGVPWPNAATSEAWSPNKYAPGDFDHSGDIGVADRATTALVQQGVCTRPNGTSVLEQYIADAAEAAEKCPTVTWWDDGATRDCCQSPF